MHAREPFLFWAVVAWAATLAQFVAELPRELAWQRPIWAFAAALALAVKSLAFLAAGLAYRGPALISRLRILVGLALASVLAGLQTA